MYELEETHTSTVRISNLYVKQEANSNVLLNGMTLHNGTTRNTTEVLLAGEGLRLIFAVWQSLIKTSMWTITPPLIMQYRIVPVMNYSSTCLMTSRPVLLPDWYWYVLMPSIQNSQQTNRNLCATRDARMYTQPQLEIYADDVKCSHGATVGQLDENALFYMRARGIAEKEARLLLMFAFVNEVIDTIRLDALKDRLHLLVEKRFRGELNKCQGCAICK